MAALNKKGPVLASRRLAYVMEHFSKHALIDLIVDRVRAERGDLASDETVMSVVSAWMSPVANVRNDKVVDLFAVDAKREKNDAKYIEQHPLRAN